MTSFWLLLLFISLIYCRCFFIDSQVSSFHIGKKSFQVRANGFSELVVDVRYQLLERITNLLGIVPCRNKMRLRLGVGFLVECQT